MHFTSLQEWHRRQWAEHAQQPQPGSSAGAVHLLPLTPSLRQAGGRARMTLRGHSGSVHKVLITPSGREAITISNDGIAQASEGGGENAAMALAVVSAP